MRDRFIIGDPDDIVQALTAYRDELGVTPNKIGSEPEANRRKSNLPSLTPPARGEHL